jgi:O-antigen/teichoic acid export membrane protein
MRRFAIPGRIGQRRSMIRRALTNTGWLMGARGINAVLSLGYLAMATRALGPEGFGHLILITAFAQAVAGLTSFQTWQAVVRWGQQPDRVGSAVGFAVALDLLSFAAGLAVAAALLVLPGAWLPIPSDLRWAAFALTAVWLLCMRSTPTGILRLRDRYGQTAVADAVTSIVRLAGSALAWILAPTIPAFLLAWAAGEIATAAAYWLYAWREQPVDRRAISLTALPRTEAGAWGFVWGTGLSGVLLVASRQIIVLIVGALGGAVMAAIYRVAMQLGEGLLKLAQALLRGTYPELVRDPDMAHDIARRIGKIALFTGFGAVALGALLGQWLIAAVAGHDYAAAYLPMLVLGAAAAIELAGASLEALLVARGHALRNFMIRAVPTALAVASLPWVVPVWGATGAAVAVLAASLLTVAGLMRITRVASA